MSNEKTTWRVERLAAQYKEGITAMAGGDVPPQLTPQYAYNIFDDFLRAAEKDRLIAYKQGKCDALRGAIDGLPNIAETDARSIELIAKYAINHSMYGGGIILSMTGAVREVKRVIAKQRGGAA